MIMKKTYFVLSLLFLALYSCTDESTFNNPSHHELERGAFIRFTNNSMPATFADAQNINFSEEVFDANNNTSSYSLTARAVVGGNTLIAEDFITITSFPATLTITSQAMADAFGVDVNDFGFGDTFNFIGTATRNDGVEFTGVPASYDSGTGQPNGSNTDAVLLDAPTYRNAMRFGTIISCPFDQAAMVGNYTIINDSGFSATGATTFDVIAGATSDAIVLVNPFDSAGNFNQTVKVNQFGIATMERQDAVLTEEVCCAGYTPTWIRTDSGKTSLALSCIGYIELNLENGLGVAGSDGTGFFYSGLKQLSASKN